MEGNGWLVSWCVGHLAGLADADAYAPEYAKWRIDDLPILPESWRFTIAKDKREQFDVLRTLLRREDVTEIVNGCDAGREGELIFRTVYCLAGCSKPIKRLWISSMEDSAIRAGFANLKDGREYDALHQAALCRAKADWLVGINATRLFSILYHRTLTLGALCPLRWRCSSSGMRRSAHFSRRHFFTVALDCGGLTLTSERFKDKAGAEAVAAACKGQEATVKSLERKEKSEKSPALFDLTALQRAANRTLGYTAQQTLDYLQALYEKSSAPIPVQTAGISPMIWPPLFPSWPPSLPRCAALRCRRKSTPRRCAVTPKSATTMPSFPPMGLAKRTCPRCLPESARCCALRLASSCAQWASPTASRKRR